MAKKGRPRIKIDLVQAEKLGNLQCTYAECSAFLGIPEGTLKNRSDFTTVYKKGKEAGKASLRRTQFKLAEKSAAMAIWLGKQYLGQSDNREEETKYNIVEFKFEVVNEDQTGPTNTEASA